MSTKIKTILVYADDIGSGGYQRYLNGIFGNYYSENEYRIIFISTKRLLKSINITSENIRIISTNLIVHRFLLIRLLSRFCIFSFIISRYNPKAIFFPNGNIKKHFTFNIPIIVTCHNLLAFENDEILRFSNPELKNYFLSIKEKLFFDYTQSYGIIFLSKYSYNIASLYIKPMPKTSIISHGVDEIIFNNFKTNYTFNQNIINILYISPIFEYKNHINVIKAIKFLKNSGYNNLKLTLIGGGDNYAINNLYNLVEKYNLIDEIHYLGEIEFKELQKHFTNTDIFLFASSCETFGITLLEAMAKALPIVCSNKSGLSDILKNAGVYFDPFSYKDIANSIIVLLQNTDKRKKLGEMARQYAKEYKWDKSSKLTLDFIKNVIYEK